ncbi:hypothetical protein [Micromonospora sp. WMMD812]|uniref:hypothetical protein n=1 Tax=Micromonospora sp. WMMD812 TaxID=3015152 RepID=UPI00248B9F39|nr:hypothetical protein [Micromonospora sp. WMMD812]WBB69033.1 hypothetical protein O7603_06685 [Micromonospora sp. WMMD812]
MTKILRLIGYWDGPAVSEGLPDVCGFVVADADATLQRAVAAYLRSGTDFVAAAGVSVCRLCGAANGSTEQTDGEYFVWPEGLAHYVEEHDVRLPDEVAAVAVRGVASTVDPEWFEHALLETGEVRIDVDWWCGLAGVSSTAPAIEHLPGCRRSESTASWDLPTSADIYVDRVPPEAVTILVRLRRLLGTSWPFSGLRDLLASQPILAAVGNPSMLYRTLTISPDLRPYLFYRAEGGLMPVWCDT